MTKYCECGCGGITSIATHTSFKDGRIKGQPNRFILGHNNQNIGEVVKKFGAWNKGRKTGYAPWRGKKRPNVSGENHHSWICDRSKLKDDHKDRGGQLHREWSRQVKNRDGWKCKISNGDCSGRVVAHHILSWRDYEELRYEINNGITLCHAHHPVKRAEEKRLVPEFQALVSVSKI